MKVAFVLFCTALSFGLMAESVAQEGAEADGPMAITFANTVVTQSETGPSTRWLFEPDGAYQAIDPSGAITRGLWTAEEGETCITPQGGAETCLVLVPMGAGLGQTWTTPLPSGASLTVTLQAGRP
jgi:hypothetical protein